MYLGRYHNRRAFYWHDDGLAYNYTLKSLHRKLYNLWGFHIWIFQEENAWLIITSAGGRYELDQLMLIPFTNFGGKADVLWELLIWSQPWQEWVGVFTRVVHTRKPWNLHVLCETPRVTRILKYYKLLNAKLT
jgi:hypothetical protein